jgi:hypothetical protein
VIKGKFQKRLLSLKEKESGLFALSVRMVVLGVLMVCPKFVFAIQRPAHQIDNQIDNREAHYIIAGPGLTFLRIRIKFKCGKSQPSHK